MAVIHLDTLNNFMNISLEPCCNSITIQLKTSFFDGDEILIVDKSNTAIVGVATLKKDGKTLSLKHRHKDFELVLPLENLKFMAVVNMSSMNPYI
ncbi:LexA family transcriptional regulator [Niallia nealsonii]|uniref:Uncharacterized protein n=1 Tax=Niallia nealsonii TaxID=115979 RepID=A0A2N0Z4E4_9BACI|nr:hypothetical protein [Niallia nealsonii]PKG24382.1 hypothetical protein CWS01_07155 [Niallia nealsonii]